MNRLTSLENIFYSLLALLLLGIVLDRLFFPTNRWSPLVVGILMVCMLILPCSTVSIYRFLHYRRQQQQRILPLAGDPSPGEEPPTHG